MGIVREIAREQNLRFRLAWIYADIGLATHMGKILECGAFSAEPFAMDVMMGSLHDDHFVLEPGSLARKASLKSIAAHSL